MPTVAELRSKVQRLFGDESATFLENADVLGWLNEAQLDIVKKTNCYTASASITIVAGTVSYSVPTGFLFAKKVILNYSELTEIDFESNKITSNSTNALEIPAGHYSIFGTSIYFPSADIATVVPCTVYYVKAPTVLTADGDTPVIPVEFHDHLVRFVLMRAKEMEEDFAVADRFNADYGQRVIQTSADVDTRNRTNNPAVRNLDDWDW